MAINTVKFTLNGQTVSLTYDSSTGTYKGTMTAPGTTSWGENSDHKYHGTVTATDTASNSTTVSYTDFEALALRVKEKTAPTIATTYPAANAYITTSTPTITWTVKDSDSGVDTSTISITIDGTEITSGITTTATTNGYTCSYTPGTALSEGSHTIKFDVSDNDGNAATQSSVTFTVDTVPPTLNVSAPADKLATNNKTCTVSFTTNDATSSPVTVKVNGTAATVNSDGTGTATVTLSEGSNTITVVATDSAGKTTTVTRTVTLDTVAPTITAIKITPNPVAVGSSVVIEVTVSD